MDSLGYSVSFYPTGSINCSINALVTTPSSNTNNKGDASLSSTTLASPKIDLVVIVGVSVFVFIFALCCGCGCGYYLFYYKKSDEEKDETGDNNIEISNKEKNIRGFAKRLSYRINSLNKHQNIQLHTAAENNANKGNKKQTSTVDLLSQNLSFVDTYKSRPPSEVIMFDNQFNEKLKTKTDDVHHALLDMYRKINHQHKNYLHMDGEKSPCVSRPTSRPASVSFKVESNPMRGIRNNLQEKVNNKPPAPQPIRNNNVMKNTNKLDDVQFFDSNGVVLLSELDILIEDIWKFFWPGNIQLSKEEKQFVKKKFIEWKKSINKNERDNKNERFKALQRWMVPSKNNLDNNSNNAGNNYKDNITLKPSMLQSVSKKVFTDWFIAITELILSEREQKSKNKSSYSLTSLF